MAERGRTGGRSAARPKAATAPARGATPWLPWRLAEAFALWAGQLRAWARAETGAGRLAPWLTVAFGLGIVLYFAATREPQLWAGGSLLLAASVAAFVVRHRGVAFALAALV